MNPLMMSATASMFSLARTVARSIMNVVDDGGWRVTISPSPGSFTSIGSPGMTSSVTPSATEISKILDSFALAVIGESFL